MAHHPEAADWEAVLAAATPIHDGVHRGVWRGERVWIKRPRSAKSNRWLFLQASAARLLPLGLLRPSVNPGGGAGLVLEANRLHSFARQGIAVPEVLHATPAMLVTRDAGDNLRRILEASPDSVVRLGLLSKAVRLLGRVHAAGLSHGRPFAKDFAFREGEPVLLDLEEDPAAAMPLATAQARDLFLLLSSAARFLPAEVDLAALLQAYPESGPPQVCRDTVRLARRIGPLAVFLERLPGRWLGRDVRVSLRALRALRRLERVVEAVEARRIPPA
ncbi:MAG: hypothetical protein EA425_08570 [Puniceicoccaceae bacterium]|nr:MAG: hypothetical protein EA425_08570 [Puniceicoccaceae bacterium]